MIWDENVNGNVYIQPEFPQIRYFLDGASYNLVDGEQTYKVLVVGGAYSVDKYYRLERAAKLNSSFSGWFKDEQLTDQEQNNILMTTAGESYDIVLTHTAPLKWEPQDLFLNFIDQSSVDKSMEKFLDTLSENINWKLWLFGHYHADRIERPHVEQFYTDFDYLSNIIQRWKKYDSSEELDWWLVKSPNFFFNDANYISFD